MQTGTIIHGTLRMQDLIPAFLDALWQVAPAAAASFQSIQDRAQGREGSAWWDGEEAAAMLERLTDTLNEHAPEGHYFGAHPGDGADFGFWKVEEGWQ